LLQPSDVALSSVTLAELAYGVAKNSRPEQNKEALNGFLTPSDILSFILQHSIIARRMDSMEKAIKY